MTYDYCLFVKIDWKVHCMEGERISGFLKKIIMRLVRVQQKILAHSFNPRSLTFFDFLQKSGHGGFYVMIFIF